MREERGQLRGNLVIDELFTLWGSVGGDVTVVTGGKFYVRGSIYGNLLADSGARIHIFGQIQGKLTVQKGAKVIISGVIGGDVVNEGGRIYIDNLATIRGKMNTISGDTQYEPKPRNFE